MKKEKYQKRSPMGNNSSQRSPLHLQGLIKSSNNDLKG